MLFSKGKAFPHKFSLPFSGWSPMHPFQLPAFPAYQCWGMVWEAFEAGWSISCSGFPLRISSYSIPEKGTKSFRASVLEERAPLG